MFQVKLYKNIYIIIYIYLKGVSIEVLITITLDLMFNFPFVSQEKKQGTWKGKSDVLSGSTWGLSISFEYLWILHCDYYILKKI